jgi:hypothetical protein
MGLRETLSGLEEEGWKALSEGRAAEFYEREMVEEAVMLLPMPVVLDKAEAVAAMSQAPPWASFSIEEPRLLRLGPDSASLVYRATAQREGSPRYRALFTSTYVRRSGAWKLALHQQTPLPEDS